jgi:hypothetical protein
VSRSRRIVLRSLTGVAAIALGCAGCGPSGSPRVAPTPEPTPLARLNTAAMALPRIDFCTLVPPTAVKDALAAAHGTPKRWGNGQGTDLPGVGEQVVAEHGCAWTAGTAAARAWTFAPPVSRTFASAVAAQARRQGNCHDLSGPPFGQPSLTQLCSDGATHRVRHAGLFGDTWLTCEVADAAPVRAVRHRADAWCVQVANVLNTTR